MSLHEVLHRLRKVKKTGTGWLTCSPAHRDEHASLSVSEGTDGRVLLHCHAGCSFNDIVGALGLTAQDLAPRNQQGGGGVVNPAISPATLQHPPGCTLADYAGAKQLSIQFLRDLGIRDFYYLGGLAIRIPYFDKDHTEAAIRFRLSLEGTDRFRWKKRSKPLPYGLWRLEEARAAGYLNMCEGESDSQTLWHNGFPALGLPGATTWREEWAEHLDGIPIIYVIDEGDDGGKALLRSLSNSSIRSRLRVVRLGSAKDP